MESKHVKIFRSLILGGVVLSAGCTLIGVYAVKGNFYPVFTGYCLSVLGYELSREKVDLVDLKFELNFLRNFDYRNISLGVIGVLLISYGTIGSSKLLLTGFTVQGVASSLFVFIGYMLVHKSVNGVLV